MRKHLETQYSRRIVAQMLCERLNYIDLSKLVTCSYLNWAHAMFSRVEVKQPFWKQIAPNGWLVYLGINATGKQFYIFKPQAGLGYAIGWIRIVC